MPRLSIPLTNLQIPHDLFVKPNGVKTWRLKYTMPSGAEGTLFIGNESMPSSQYF